MRSKTSRRTYANCSLTKPMGSNRSLVISKMRRAASLDGFMSRMVVRTERAPWIMGFAFSRIVRIVLRANSV